VNDYARSYIIIMPHSGIIMYYIFYIDLLSDLSYSQQLPLVITLSHI